MRMVRTNRQTSPWGEDQLLLVKDLGFCNTAPALTTIGPCATRSESRPIHTSGPFQSDLWPNAGCGHRGSCSR